MSDGFDFRGIDLFSEQLVRVSNDNPKKTKKFLQKQGTKLKQKTLQTAKQRVKKRTGKYYRSIKRGKIYTFGGSNVHAIRVYSGARHAHLIEDGHRIISHGMDVGFQRGKRVFADSRSAFEPSFESATEEFVDTIIGEVER